VLDGVPATLPQKGWSPTQFSAHVYCGQTAGWIKTPLGTEVGLCLRDIVFDVDELTPGKGHTHPTQILAHVYCDQLAGWMKKPLGTKVDLGPGHIVPDGVPAPAKGAQQPPSFRPMSIVATVRPSQLLLSSCMYYYYFVFNSRFAAVAHPNC